MRNTLEVLIRYLFYFAYCIWVSLYLSYLGDNMDDVFAVTCMIVVILMGLMEAWFDRFLPVSILEWENYCFWTILVIVTINNIIHWDEIVASHPKYFRIFTGNIFR